MDDQEARLDAEKHELQAALAEQGRLADADKARLKGESAALQEGRQAVEWVNLKSEAEDTASACAGPIGPLSGPG